MSDRKFNPEDYVDVQSRLHWFWKEHPNGRIETELVHLKDRIVVFKAMIWKDREAPPEKPDATGWAHEIYGEGHVNKTKFIENAETSAIGRALANLNYPGNVEMAQKVAATNGQSAPWDRGPGAAPRPSREEMMSAKRWDFDPDEPYDEHVDSDLLDTACSFKKHKGRTWREVLRDDPKYVKWIVDNVDDMDEDLRFALSEALEQMARAAAPAPSKSPFEDEDDDLPF